MDTDVKHTLLKIEEHLKALVNLKVVKIMEEKEKAGDFNSSRESGGGFEMFDQERKDIIQKEFVKEIYSDLK